MYIIKYTFKSASHNKTTVYRVFLMCWTPYLYFMGKKKKKTESQRASDLLGVVEMHCVQLWLVPGTARLLTPEPCSHMIATLQKAASSEVSTQNVLCTQNGICLRCVGTHKVCTYHKVSICPNMCISQSVYILLEVWYMHEVWNILQNVCHTFQCDNTQHVVWSPQCGTRRVQYKHLNRTTC